MTSYLYFKKVNQCFFCQQVIQHYTYISTFIKLHSANAIKVFLSKSKLQASTSKRKKAQWTRICRMRAWNLCFAKYYETKETLRKRHKHVQHCAFHPYSSRFCRLERTTMNYLIYLFIMGEIVKSNANHIYTVLYISKVISRIQTLQYS
jgi:hypothetical protein